jgi:RNA polymerase sigma-70 factor (ECF subfamily)
VESDATLIARSAAGDQEAFAVLVERHYEPCWRFARRMLGDDADAADALHDSFLRARAALPRYKEQDNFRAWLFRILTNQCRTAALATRRREHRFVAGDAVLDELPSNAQAVADDLGLHEAIAALAPEAREALLLKHGQGFEYREIAEMLGISESAAKMRVSRACQAVREKLEVGNE